MEDTIITVETASVPSETLQTEITALIGEINQFLKEQWAYVSLEFDPQLKFTYNKIGSKKQYCKAAVDHVVDMMNKSGQWTVLRTNEEAIKIYDQKKHTEAIERNSSGGR
jgi:hypothetical protein